MRHILISCVNTIEIKVKNKFCVSIKCVKMKDDTGTPKVLLAGRKAFLLVARKM